MTFVQTKVSNSAVCDARLARVSENSSANAILFEHSSKMSQNAEFSLCVCTTKSLFLIIFSLILRPILIISHFLIIFDFLLFDFATIFFIIQNYFFHKFLKLYNYLQNIMINIHEENYQK